MLSPVESFPSLVPAPLHGAGPLQLLIVCPRGEQLDTARRLARQRSGHHALHWTDDPDRAVQLAVQHTPDLAIVDARIDRATAGDLVQRLNRCNTAMVVLSFDDRSTASLRQTHSTWYWNELPRALHWWQERAVR